MNDRERLVKLLRQAADVVTHSPGASTWGAVAEYLISHGVTVQKQGEVDNIELQFIGIEQPDRSKEIYTFVFDFEINGVDYHYRRKLTPEFFENFEYKKEKHGRWEYHDCVCTGEGLAAVYSCSECNVCIGEEAFEQLHTTIYCPNCGAKMDGEADGKV